MNEISQENLSALNKTYKSASIIYLGQIFFAVILIIIGWFYTSNVNFSMSEESLTALRVGVIFIAITTLILRRMLFRWESLKVAALLKGIPGLLSSLRANAIILGTMAEIIAIIGSVITILGGVKTDMLTFGAVALILFLINFPRKSIWRKIIANLENI